MINQKIMNLAKLLKNNAIKNKNHFWMLDEINHFIFDYKMNEEYLGREEMLAVLTCIVEDGFDMTNWELREIPISTVYSFSNPEETKFFDIEVREKENIDIDEWYYEGFPTYYDEDGQAHETKTIQEAVENYSLF